MKIRRAPGSMFRLTVLLVAALPVHAELRILFCSDKAATGSFDLFTIKPDGTLSFTDAGPDTQRRFYRVRGVCP
jgi:hypothetical protein